MSDRDSSNMAFSPARLHAQDYLHYTNPLKGAVSRFFFLWQAYRQLIRLQDLVGSAPTCSTAGMLEQEVAGRLGKDREAVTALKRAADLDPKSADFRKTLDDWRTLLERRSKRSKERE